MQMHITERKILRQEKGHYTSTTTRIMNFIAELELAGHKIDMLIIQRGAGKHSPMRMESCASDWGRPVVMKEARVWLKRGQVCTIHVESLDFVAISSPAFYVSSGLNTNN